NRLAQQSPDVALTLAEHVARKGVRVDLDERGGAVPRQRQRRYLRQSTRHRRLAGARRSGEHDESVRQSREHRQFAPVVQDEQRLRQQAFLHLARNDDRVPVAIVMLRREELQREHAGRKSGARNVHQSPGRLSSGHWICDSSCIETSVSSASSNSTIGSTPARIVSSGESNMWMRTSRHWLTGSSLKC